MGKRKTISDISDYLKIHLPNLSLEEGQTYLNNKSYLDFNCSLHGHFSTSWNQVQRGSHCPECGKNRLKRNTQSKRTSIATVIAKIDSIHKGSIKIVNPEDYEKQHSRLTFRCQFGHKWDTKVYTVIQGRGCPKCAGKNITTEEFIESLNQVHSGDIQLMPDQKYKSRKSKLDFKCKVPEHPVFSAVPSNIIFKKSGCPECKKDSLREHFAFNTEEVYQKIKEKCGDQVIPLPNQEYVNQMTKWEFTCSNPNHKNWRASIGNVLNSNYKFGCRECMGEVSFDSVQSIKNELKKIFSGKITLLRYDESSFFKNSLGYFYCGEHNKKFTSTLTNVFNAKGCPQCSLDSRVEKRRTDSETLLKQVYKVHRDLVTIVDPEQYVNTETKIDFKCHKNKHGIFSSTPHSILAGVGCPVCSMSRGERKVLFWLRDHSIDHIYQWRVKKHKGRGQFIYDFYVESERIVIEYDGRQHFEPIEYWGGKKGLEKIQMNDKLKNEYAELNSLRILRIKYTDYDNVEALLNNFFES